MYSCPLYNTSKMNGKLTVILLPETLENNKINATIFRGIRLTLHAFSCYNTCEN